MTDNWQVLIVEDEFDSAQMVSKILTHHKIEVTVAHNGQEALDVLTALVPTIIVMDLSMPEMDGWTTLMEIRANPNTAHIPVVAMTAYHSVNVAQDAIAAGFDAYFPKPVEPGTFVQSLSEIVNRY